ncbi:hypothetical protein L6R29_20175 [Myxococcota bacterium]|nr:hypothetical protein [Myxococcota bacterium]
MDSTALGAERRQRKEPPAAPTTPHRTQDAPSLGKATTASRHSLRKSLETRCKTL